MSLPGITSLNPENTPTPTTPAAPAAPQVDTTEPEGTQLVGTSRMAPVSAVIEERRAKQAAKAEADALRSEVEQLRQVKQNWDTVEPYLPLLATHPRVTGKPAAPAAPPPAQDPELLQIAETWGFYDAEGQPDIKRATAARDYMDKRAGAKVEEAVKPVAATAANAQARALRERAYQVVDKSGQPFAKREHIDQVLNSLPPDQQSVEEVVGAALLMARGLGVTNASEPLHTEGPGRARPGSSVGLSSVERAAMRARGMTEQQWISSRDDKDTEYGQPLE